MLALLGEVLVDLIEENQDPLRFRGVLGGSVLNTATTLVRLGFPVRFLSEVGEDWVSAWSEEEMRKRGLELRLFRHPAPMPLALVRLDAEGNGEYSFHRPFHLPYRPGPEGLRGARVFHFGSLLALEDRVEEGLGLLLQEAEEEGAFVSYDPNLRRSPTPKEKKRIRAYLDRIDLLKLSLEDAKLLFPEDPVRAVKTLDVPLKVLTLGREGAVAFLGKEAVRLPGKAVRVKDTVGAGDAFTAGLLALLLRKGYGKGNLPRPSLPDLKEILEGAIALSALACTVRGAYLPEKGLRSWQVRYLGDEEDLARGLPPL